MLMPGVNRAHEFCVLTVASLVIRSESGRAHLGWSAMRFASRNALDTLWNPYHEACICTITQLSSYHSTCRTLYLWSTRAVYQAALQVGYYSMVAIHEPLSANGIAHLRVQWCKNHWGKKM